MATMHWGRKETIIFPPHGAIYTYGAMFFAVILTGLFVYLRFTFGNSPLQRFYTPIYIRSSVAAGVGRPAPSWGFGTLWTGQAVTDGLLDPERV